MKFAIYNDDMTVPKPPTFLRLKERPNGIEVVAVDSKGNTVTAGHLLTFNEKGDIFPHRAIDSELGFDLDAMGRIKIQ